MFHPIRLSFAFFLQFLQFFLFFRREPNDIFLVHTDPFQKNDTLKVVSAIPIQPLKSNVMRYYYDNTTFGWELQGKAGDSAFFDGDEEAVWATRMGKRHDGGGRELFCAEIMQILFV